jgi:hypothetical protein
MIRFSNKRPKLHEWTVTFATQSLIEHGSSGLGWRQVRFGIFKLMEEPIEGALIQSHDYKGFIIFFRLWFPFEGGY